MTTEAINEEAMQYAFGRIRAFAAVQEGRNITGQLDAVNILLESLGLSEDLKDQLGEWLDDFIGTHSGEILLGLLIGLFMLQYHIDKDN